MEDMTLDLTQHNLKQELLAIKLWANKKLSYHKINVILNSWKSWKTN